MNDRDTLPPSASTRAERDVTVVKGVLLAALQLFPPGERAVALERIVAAARYDLSKRDTQPTRVVDILGKDGDR